jgi:hypothetical protein
MRPLRLPFHGHLAFFVAVLVIPLTWRRLRSRLRGWLRRPGRLVQQQYGLSGNRSRRAISGVDAC